MNRFAHVSLVVLSLALVPACSSGENAVAAAADGEIAVNGELGTDVFVEDHDDGSVAWRIDPSGEVKASVSTGAGARITNDVSGALVYKVAAGEPKTVPLVVDAKTGLLVAAGPKLEADLTEVSYTLNVAGKPWSGVMHVPAGGTAALVAGSKASAEAKLPDEAVGPHGGTIQVVGGDRLEMVADESGETRVYVLDASLRPVKVEARTLRMGFIAQQTTFVSFAPDPVGFFFVAKLGTGVVLNPLRVTVALGVGSVTHAAIWGYRPGVRIYAPTATVKVVTAPRIHFVLKGGFDAGVDVYGRAHAKVAVKDDDDGKKGNNGRHVGQDGTWDRDSDGSKSNDPHGSKAKGGHDDKGGGNDSKSAGKGGGNDDKGGGAKSSGHDDKGGGSAKSSGGGSSKGGSASVDKSSGGSKGGGSSGGAKGGGSSGSSKGGGSSGGKGKK
jgi:hypothetical protein